MTRATRRYLRELIETAAYIAAAVGSVVVFLATNQPH